ncbi:MAG: hypothetical protein LUQ34_04070, partial [Euryarchaeota archaeon]|nr:hypothetical protein [Euryarchaeota archaeon]
MAEIIKQITGYQVVRYPGHQAASAAILIFCEDEYRLLLVFQEQLSADTTSTSYDPQAKQGVAYFDGNEQYPHYIDLLRNEGPLFAFFYLDETSNEIPPLFTIQTGKEICEREAEAIGEGE